MTHSLRWLDSPARAREDSLLVLLLLLLLLLLSWTSDVGVGPGLDFAVHACVYDKVPIPSQGLPVLLLL